MELIALATAIGLAVVSFSLNAFQFYVLRQTRLALQKSLEKPPKPDPVPSLTAEQLIHDLTAGAAVVRIERINPSDIFLRSPRT